MKKKSLKLNGSELTGLTTTMLLFEGSEMTLGEACAKTMRNIIERDVPDLPGFDPNVSPYNWVADRIGKSKQTVRNWTYEWGSGNGRTPKVGDLLLITYVTKSKRFAELFLNIVSDESLEEQKDKYQRMIRMVAKHMGDMSNNLDSMADDIQNN